MKESAKFWHASDIGDLELLRATYISHRFSRHAHPGYVIGAIERGVEVFDYRGRTHAAIPGDIVVINPDEVHTGHSGGPAGWTYRMFYPSTAVMQTVSVSISDKTGQVPYFRNAVVKDHRLAKRLLELHRLLERSPSRLARETCFFEVMAELIFKYASNPPRTRRMGPERQAVTRAVAYIHDNLTENFSLKELSRHVGLSPFYLSRIFRRQVGLPPHAYQKQQRIYLAKKLLRQNTPIAAAAAEAGFSDQSHLTRHFKQILGVTPGRLIAARS